MIDTFLEVNNLTLEIPLFNVNRSFRTSLINRLTGATINQDEHSKQISIRALHDISFRLEAGDRLGLVGHNGAGKTTLLRLLSRIYRPIIGNYRYYGRITPLFNMSLGLDLDDTGIDNIYTIGMHLGMTKSEIEAKRNDIIEFSDLGDYIYLPMRIYSAGMQMRLSFAIATSLDPDILLMDEGIGAGDANFAEKAEGRLSRFYEKCGIMVVASHSDDLIRKLCNKALLLEKGRQIAIGPVEEILSLYSERR
jgi:ABC-type polysaccharide/polyol phosphate transport system ATPase subunit